jgi:eukaryotic-like serine/threonine-protein kinase
MLRADVSTPTSNPAIPAGLPAVGEVLAGKYRIEGVLGVGGMGAVLAAKHLHLDERVAIKVMLPQAMGDGATTVRFLREARAAVKIKSEHVARVTDSGVLDDGRPYIVMEYLIGQDLGAVLEQNGRLSVTETVDYLLQACEAVAQAHALGIVHRDLKPANLFLTVRDDGSACVKVLDFGISKATPQAQARGGVESLQLTTTQTLVGSPMYMAPEQMRTNRPVDGRTDIWSLGVVAYELLTGRLPFEASAMPELCAKILQDDPEPLRKKRPELGADLEATIHRCLEKKPERRFQNLADFASAMAPFGSKGAEGYVPRISRALRTTREEISGVERTISASSIAEPPTLANARTAATWAGARGTPAGGRSTLRTILIGGLLFTPMVSVVVYLALSHPAGTQPDAHTQANPVESVAPPGATDPASGAASTAVGVAPSQNPPPTVAAAPATGAPPVAVAAPDAAAGKPKYMSHSPRSSPPPSKPAPPTPAVTVASTAATAAPLETSERSSNRKE